MEFYYINTNEKLIPGEFLHENMISSHVKITRVKISPLLWVHNKSRLSQDKTYSFSEMVGYFIGVYIINKTLHGCLEIRNFSSHVENISLVCVIFQHLKRNFVSRRSHVISSISYIYLVF